MSKASFSRAALKGILGAAAAASVATVAMANAAATDKAADPKGSCFGANGCKGESACATPGGHACHGQNSCKGTGWVRKSKSECEAMAKNDKNIQFGRMVKMGQPQKMEGAGKGMGTGAAAGAADAKPATPEKAADKPAEAPAEKK